MNFMALHGFLGSSEDWSFLNGKETSLQAIDLNDFFESSFFQTTKNTFSDFCDWLKPQIQEPIILLGYSLGGRLAMHALVKYPERLLGVVLVSAHPGLESDDEKRSRLESDLLWAQRFANEPWRSVIVDWNRQTVFQGSKMLDIDKVHRHAQLYLDHFSLSRQTDMREALRTTRTPTLYVTGSYDTKFCQLAEKLKRIGNNPNLSTAIAPSSGHRVLHDNPTWAREQILKWSNAIEKNEVKPKLPPAD